MNLSKVRLAGRYLIFAGIFLQGCAAAPPIKEYVPLPAAASPEGAPTLKTAVGLTDNQSHLPTATEMNAKLADVLKGWKTIFVTPEVSAVTSCFAAPEKLTEFLIKDLKASGAFVSVEDEGVSPADVVVKPVLKTCTMSIVGYNVHNVIDLSLQVQVMKRGKVAMDKTYTQEWLDVNLGDVFNVLSQNLLPPVMKQIREDIVANAVR